MKRQPTELEKIFGNDISAKELISKVYKECLQFKSKKPNNPVRKRTKDLNRLFSKEDIRMANGYMKRCSISLILRKLQIRKTAVRYHLTPVTMAMNRKTKDKCWQGRGEIRTLVHCW